jgi:hypothetical protein
MSLGGKYGPGSAPADPEVAAARLDAYGRAARAAAGGPRPPILQVDDERLAALFAPRALENLVIRPLRREPPHCAE